MEAAKAGKVRFGPRHALAGLEAGVIGALVMLGFVALASAFSHRSVWLVPNLFGTTFAGSDAYRNAYGPGSLTGVAIFVAIYGLLGLIGGLFTGEQKRSGMTLFGAIAGLAIYYVMFHFVWKHLNPLITLYSPDRQLEAGHILWGMIVAQSPKFARRIASAINEGAVESETILVSQP